MTNQLAQATDEILIQLSQQGQTAAYGELYQRYMENIYKYIYYRLRDEHDAEDLTETVFFKAWQALPTYEQTGVPFLAWLYRIAHNLLMDHHRKQALHQHRLPQIYAESAFIDTDNTAELDENLSTADDEQKLFAAVATLDPLHQTVLLLRFVQGLEHEAVAQIVNRTAGAVRVIQHRALKILRDKLTKP